MKKITVFLSVMAIFVMAACPWAFAAGPEKPVPKEETDPRRQLAEKFAQLSDDEKDKIYSLTDKAVMQVIKLMQEYAESGLADREKTDNVSKMLLGMTKQAREKKEFFPLLIYFPPNRQNDKPTDALT